MGATETIDATLTAATTLLPSNPTPTPSKTRLPNKDPDNDNHKDNHNHKDENDQDIRAPKVLILGSNRALQQLKIVEHAVRLATSPASTTPPTASSPSTTSPSSKVNATGPNVVYLGASSLHSCYSDDDDEDGNHHPNPTERETKRNLSRSPEYRTFTSRFQDHFHCPLRFHDLSLKDREGIRLSVETWADIVLCDWGEDFQHGEWIETFLREVALEKDLVVCGVVSVMGKVFEFTTPFSGEEKEDGEHVRGGNETINKLDVEQDADLNICNKNDSSNRWICIPPDTAVSQTKRAQKLLKKQALLRHPHQRILAIDNLAALLLTGHHSMAISGDVNSTCHILAMDDSQNTISMPLPWNWMEPIPTLELLELHAPAKAPHLESLEDFVDTDFVIAGNVAEMMMPSTTVSNANSCRDGGDDDDADDAAIGTGTDTDTDETQPATEAVPKIVAAGRMKALQMKPIVEKIIQLSNTPLPKLLYIGTASFDRTDKFLMCTQAFRELGCEIRRLDVSEEDTVPSAEEMREMVVEWPEVILCSGGNTLHALLRWKEVGLDLLMKESGLNGTVLCGASAGAGCWFSSLHTDSLRPDNTKNREHVLNELTEKELQDWDYAKISALGFIDAMCVPHFDATGTNGAKRAEDAEQILLEDPSTSVIGVDENAALVVVGGDAMAVSGDGKATCHVMMPLEETGEVISAPIPTHWEEPIPMEEILDLPAPASAPHLESLEKYVDTDFVIADDFAQELASSEAATSCCDERDADSSTASAVVPKIVASGNERGMQLKPIVDKIVELSGVDLPKVLYIGTASFDRTDKFLMNTKMFREMGCEIRRLDVSEQDTVPSAEDMREMVVEWPHVILCSGGNTLHALIRWKEIGLDMLMKEAGMEGKVLCGGSAGAGCWFSSLHTDSLRPDNTKNKEHVLNELSEEELSDWNYTKISALGFIDAMCVPHYNARGTNGEMRSEHAEKILLEDPSTTMVIGVDNNAAFMVLGNDVMAVSGDGKATCHVIVPDERTGEAMSAPLPTDLEELIPLEDVFKLPLSEANSVASD
eukprot:CAMPEP_0171331486 /NCGR_PEP_ID=MMETSP0878-20121228/2727_1 /TAXON_ID=67004 /ORGANISM="Thalassiosira weissflogii, Strain CCMP1336" /LENGTH=1046 /DNA_ID=CAMNT_0011832027 /DNA_START=353 /DNA_END=3493 /DNA_ORIENTATION=+